jgi:hypothetical protein
MSVQVYILFFSIFRKGGINDVIFQFLDKHLKQSCLKFQI